MPINLIGTINGTAAGDRSGVSVCLSSDGTTFVIGDWFNNSETGRARIFRYNSDNSWTQIGTINGTTAADRSGLSLSLSSDGNTFAIGDYRNDVGGSNAGRVRVFRYASGTNWTQIGTLNGVSPGDQTGASVALSSDGNTVAIGENTASYTGGSAGRVRILKYSSGTTWNVIGTINGLTGDQAGGSVYLSSDGTILAVGAIVADTSVTDSGNVRIFRYSTGTTWTLIGTINGTATGDRTGTSVSLSSDGRIIAVGEPLNSAVGSLSGRTRIFRYVSDNNWTQIGTINGTAAQERTGTSVSLSSDGRILAVGDPQNGLAGSNAGRARIFRYVNDNNWVQTWTINSIAAGDQTGSSVFLNSTGKILAVGAQFNDSGGTDSGNARIFRLLERTNRPKISGFLGKI